MWKASVVRFVSHIYICRMDLYVKQCSYAFAVPWGFVMVYNCLFVGFSSFRNRFLVLFLTLWAINLWLINWCEFCWKADFQQQNCVKSDTCSIGVMRAYSPSTSMSSTWGLTALSTPNGNDDRAVTDQYATTTSNSHFYSSTTHGSRSKSAYYSYRIRIGCVPTGIQTALIASQVVCIKLRHISNRATNQQIYLVINISIIGRACAKSHRHPNFYRRYRSLFPLILILT